MIRSTIAMCTVLPMFLVACSESPTTPTTFGSSNPTIVPQSNASLLNSNAPFKNWHQGFNQGTAGWFGSETMGPLGWCGEIEQSAGGVGPSAGRAYATVAQSGCNAFWTPIFTSDFRTGPWAPGPDFAGFSTVWPNGGFVVELDIYLDPTWTAAELDPGSFILGPGGTVFTYAVSVRELASPANAFGSFRYFGVPVIADGGKLLIFGREVSEAGWYTFRHVIGNDSGHLAVDFELAERRGGTLFTIPVVTTTTLFGEPGETVSDLSATDFGSGYIWFLSISPGLDLPIDEHRVRRGK